MLTKQIEHYLHQTKPIFDASLAESLAEWKIKDLSEHFDFDVNKSYSTANAYLKEVLPIHSGKRITKRTVLEQPDFGRLNDFYSENGLEPLLYEQQESLMALDQLKNAFNFIAQDEHCAECILPLVKCIQVLRQPEPEFDVSYSHPKVPFTIFVSIGDLIGENEVVRLSESIIHEAMHLKLTLIENLLPLVSDNTKVYYSPWREENRPIKGVLHGAFVFRAIYDFYEFLISRSVSEVQRDFISWRIQIIRKELESIRNFYNCRGLTSLGAGLGENLVTLK